MAKWGEGDPRWIVEERPDAVNVNNWHWTEKNATPWSKDKLQAIFENFEITQNDIKVTVEKVEKISGEASANNRKGKLIFFYEWELVLKWSGRLSPGQKESCLGQIKIPNLSEENELDEVDVQVTADKSDRDSDELKQFMYNVGRDKIRDQLGVYLVDLREEFSKGMILPRKAGDEGSNGTTAKQQSGNCRVNNITSGFNSKISFETTAKAEKKESPPAIGCKLNVANVEMSVMFQCQPPELYDALTRIEMATAFTRGLVKLEPIKGGEFSFFGGNISGRFEELVPNKSIKQSWRYKEWPAGHYSQVFMLFEENDGQTKLTLTQTGVPKENVEATRTNWSRFYWDSIKVTFGFGSFLV